MQSIQNLTHLRSKPESATFITEKQNQACDSLNVLLNNTLPIQAFGITIIKALIYFNDNSTNQDLAATQLADLLNNFRKRCDIVIPGIMMPPNYVMVAGRKQITQSVIPELDSLMALVKATDRSFFHRKPPMQNKFKEFLLNLKNNQPEIFNQIVNDENRKFLVKSGIAIAVTCDNKKNKIEESKIEKIEAEAAVGKIEKSKTEEIKKSLDYIFTGSNDVVKKKLPVGIYSAVNINDNIIKYTVAILVLRSNNPPLKIQMLFQSFKENINAASKTNNKILVGTKINPLIPNQIEISITGSLTSIQEVLRSATPQFQHFQIE